MLATCFARICLQGINCKHRLPHTVRRHRNPTAPPASCRRSVFVCRSVAELLHGAYSPAVVTSSKRARDVCCGTFRTSHPCLVMSAYEGEAEVFEKRRHFR